MISNLRIASARLVLRPFHRRDAAQALRCMTPALTRHLDWAPPTSAEAFRGEWQRWLAGNAGGSDRVFTILDARGFVGLAGLYATSTPTPEFGLWIREQRQGRGYGGEAAASLLAWAAERWRPQRFVCVVASENHASRRIAVRLGGRLGFVRPVSGRLQLVYLVPAAARARADGDAHGARPGEPGPRPPRRCEP